MIVLEGLASWQLAFWLRIMSCDNVNFSWNSGPFLGKRSWSLWLRITDSITWWLSKSNKCLGLRAICDETLFPGSTWRPDLWLFKCLAIWQVIIEEAIKFVNPEYFCTTSIKPYFKSIGQLCVFSFFSFTLIWKSAGYFHFNLGGAIHVNAIKLHSHWVSLCRILCGKWLDKGKGASITSITWCKQVSHMIR